MLLAVLTFLAAFSIEGIGTVVSVIGLSALFGTNPIIIGLAVALDAGKLVTVALLYKYWGKINVLMRTYGLIAAFITMLITSAGAAGYLSGEFQRAVVGTQEVMLKVDLLKEEQARLQKRKEQIDLSIAQIPDRYTAAQKIRLGNQFRAEQKGVTDRLTAIDRELPTLQVNRISVEAKAGPILYIAKAFNISIEEAVKWVILLIIFVFDPLAVFLLVAGNFLLDQRRKQDPPAEPGPAPFTPPQPMPPAPAPPPEPAPPAAREAMTVDQAWQVIEKERGLWDKVPPPAQVPVDLATIFPESVVSDKPYISTLTPSSYEDEFPAPPPELPQREPREPDVLPDSADAGDGAVAAVPAAPSVEPPVLVEPPLILEPKPEVVAQTFTTDLRFRKPDPDTPEMPLTPEPAREQITRSTLGIDKAPVRPRPGVYRNG